MNSRHHSITISGACAAIAFLIGAIAPVPAHAAAADACSVRPSSPLVVNVKDKGAKGDGQADDTKAIQKTIDAVAGTGGTVYVPNGTFMVRGVGKHMLKLKSKMTFKLADRAVLEIIPNGDPHYAALRLSDVSDVNVVGGTLQGDRKEHKNNKGEWGMGVWIDKGSKRVVVSGVTAKGMWGDGFYIAGADHVALCGVKAIKNRRQGLSIVDGDHILITQSEFRETKGTAPSAGIDIEPNRKPAQTVTNVDIEGSTFVKNAGGGVMISGKKGVVAKVRITGNVFEGNRPVLIENAPQVRSTQICKNRIVAKQAPASQGFNAFAEPVDTVALQGDCREGRDIRFETNRMTKKKQPSND